MPTTATEPYVCPGVPQRSAELVLGSDVEATSFGSWKPDVALSFTCVVAAASGGDARLKVLSLPIGVIGEGGDEAVIQYLGGEDAVEPITADAAGHGWVARLPTSARALWVCGDLTVQARLDDADVDGRDEADDVTNLLVSVLPWACEGEPVPEST